MYKKTLATGILLLFLLGMVSPLSVGFKIEQQSRGDILYVGGSGAGNYTRIQDAIADILIFNTFFTLN